MRRDWTQIEPYLRGASWLRLSERIRLKTIRLPTSAELLDELHRPQTKAPQGHHTSNEGDE
jgi:hypothetical protein